MGVMVENHSTPRVDPNPNCPYCSGLDAIRLSAENDLHRGVQDLRNNALASCGGCWLLFHGVTKALAATGKPDHVQILHKGTNDRRYSLFIAYEASDRLSRDFRFVLLDKDEVTPIASVNFRSPQDYWQCFPACGSFGDTSSTYSTEWAIDRIHSCQSQCAECRRPVGLLPTRVLDVGIAGEVDLKDDLQLREGGGERGQYACLSHRWGHIPPFRLFSANLETLKGRILWQQLPESYKDAIQFTRKIGLRYLWIDALCILQDDSDDWDREWAKMGDVFSFSTLTLAATASRDDTQGLFRTIEPPPVINFTDAQGRSRNLVVYESKLTSLSRELTKAPLLGRAWVFQERLLSPRMLHFCNGFLVFECMHQTITEDGFFSRTTSQSKIEHIRSLTESSEFGLASRWRSIVENYSWQNFTFERDRLPAIYGLSRQMASYRKDEYMSGLWYRSLLDDLAWRKPQRMNKRSSAPTWSWAKGDGGIVYDIKVPMTPQARLISHSEVNPERDAMLFSNGSSAAPSCTDESARSKDKLSVPGTERPVSSWSSASRRSSMMRPTTSSRVSSFITPSIRTTNSSGVSTPIATHSITLHGRLGRLPVILGQSFPKMRPLRLTEFTRDASFPQPVLFPDNWLEADALEGRLYCVQLGYDEQYIYGLALRVRDETSFERIGLIRCEFAKNVPVEHQLLLMEKGCEQTNVTIF